MINRKISDPVQYIKGVGPKKAELLKRIGVETVEDMIWLMPRRYEDRTNIAPVSAVKEGEILTVAGKIAAAGIERTRTRMRIFKAAVSDGTGIIYANFFNQPYLKEYLKPGMKVVMYGKVTRFGAKQLVMNVPEYEILPEEKDSSIHMGRLVPIYPAVEHLHQRFIRTLVRDVLSKYAGGAEDIIPEDIRLRCGIMPIRKAFWFVHFPGREADAENARRRLAFEEFFIIQLGMLMRKHYINNFVKGISHAGGIETAGRFEKALPFELTGAQKKVIGEIINDMRSARPMNRLLQGDVGSGKTVAALYSLVYASAGGYQGALMVPTEILARQHFRNICGLVEPLGIRAGLLISDMPQQEHIAVKKGIENGDIDIIIGTHALIQEKVSYKKLGIVVIDEQHKFGVMQRALLGEKGRYGLSGRRPDVLIMTATPIPRSLAMTVYGNMDISIIDEMPEGRGKVVTYWIPEEKLPKAYEFIRKEINKGRQAYIVYPLVDESEKIKLPSVSGMAKKLGEEEFPGLRIGVVHGRMPAEEKKKVMEEFREGKVHILVATTVIEVGIDIKNATVMLVEHAERFGLSQLHQLRGRIGRGSHYSYCILQADPATIKGRRRLHAMESAPDGFRISQEDLDIRGPGDFFGTRQHGLPELRAGNITSDIDIMERAGSEARTLLKGDPGLKSPEHKKLYIKVKSMFGNRPEAVYV